MPQTLPKSVHNTVLRSLLYLEKNYNVERMTILQRHSRNQVRMEHTQHLVRIGFPNKLITHIYTHTLDV